MEYSGDTAPALVQLLVHSVELDEVRKLVVHVSEALWFTLPFNPWVKSRQGARATLPLPWYSFM